MFSIGFADSFAHCMCMDVCVCVRECMWVFPSALNSCLLQFAQQCDGPRPHTLPDPPHQMLQRDADTTQQISAGRFDDGDGDCAAGQWKATAERHFALDLLQFCSADVGSDVSFAPQPLACAGAEAFGWASSASTTVRRCFESSFCVFTRIWYIFFSWVHLLLLLLVVVIVGAVGQVLFLLLFARRGEVRANFLV